MPFHGIYFCVDSVGRDEAYASFDPKYWHTMRPRRSNNNDSYEFLCEGRGKKRKNARCMEMRVCHAIHGKPTIEIN